MPAQAVASTQASPPALTYDSDDTDSDDDSVTNVQLGIADGQLEDEDEINPLVSRIGGRVVSAHKPLPVFAARSQPHITATALQNLLRPGCPPKTSRLPIQPPVGIATPSWSSLFKYLLH